MNLAKRAQNERRVIRRERWIGLWLMRLVAFLEAYERTPLGRALYGPIARILLIFSDALVNSIALRATWSPAYRRRITAGRSAGCATAQKGADRRRAKPRALLGGALRRALKAKSLKARAEALLRLMRMRERWVAIWPGVWRAARRGFIRRIRAPRNRPSTFLRTTCFGWSSSPNFIWGGMAPARSRRPKPLASIAGFAPASPP